MATTIHGHMHAIPATKNPGSRTRAKEVIVARRRRKTTQEIGRAIETLGHAIEYLADEFSLDCMDPGVRIAPGINPRIMAIEILMARNRELYFSCPEVPSLGERLRSLLRLQRA